jgi:hypothetical protein
MLDTRSDPYQAETALATSYVALGDAVASKDALVDGLEMSVRGAKQTLQPGGRTPSFTWNGPHAD